MDILLEMAKDMGEAIQQDDRFITLQMAQAAADDDAALQDLIGEFNLKRIALSGEENKEKKDAQKIKRLDTELRAVYARVMENEHMAAYNAARSEMDALLSGINRILHLSAQGENPRSIDVSPRCTGDCGSCGGCS